MYIYICIHVSVSVCMCVCVHVYTCIYIYVLYMIFSQCIFVCARVHLTLGTCVYGCGLHWVLCTERSELDGSEDPKIAGWWLVVGGWFTPLKNISQLG